MSVISLLSPSPRREPSYPRLRIGRGDSGSPGTVVLFIEGTTGVVLYAPAGSFYTVGRTSASWSPAEFEDFEGALVLRNP